MEFISSLGEKEKKKKKSVPCSLSYFLSGLKRSLSGTIKISSLIWQSRTRSRTFVDRLPSLHKSLPWLPQIRTICISPFIFGGSCNWVVKTMCLALVSCRLSRRLSQCKNALWCRTPLVFTSIRIPDQGLKSVHPFVLICYKLQAASCILLAAIMNLSTFYKDKT